MSNMKIKQCECFDAHNITSQSWSQSHCRTPLSPSCMPGEILSIEYLCMKTHYDEILSIKSI